MTISFSKKPPRDDLNHVGWFMRDIDQRELFAANGEAPVNTVHTSWASSLNPYLFYWDNKPCFVCGIVPMTETIAVPWMVATDLWEDIPKKLLWRLSRHFIQDWLAAYPVLTNYVDARNGVARDWLAKLGATEQEVTPYGHLKLPFIRFEIKAPCANQPP